MNTGISIGLSAIILLTNAYRSPCADAGDESKVGLLPEIGPLHWGARYDESEIHGLRLIGERRDPGALATVISVHPKEIECLSVERDAVERTKYVVRSIAVRKAGDGVSQVREQSAPLSKSDAEKIQKLWISQLAKVRVRSAPALTNAPEYHFSAHVGKQLVCGYFAAFDKDSAGIEAWRMFLISDHLSSLANCAVDKRDEHLKNLRDVLDGTVSEIIQPKR